MSKNKIIFLIGFILFLMPFLGFQSRWEDFVQIVSGLILLSLSFSVVLKRRATVRARVRRSRKVVAPEPFVDSHQVPTSGIENSSNDVTSPTPSL